jgi:hypothetical protein
LRADASRRGAKFAVGGSTALLSCPVDDRDAVSAGCSGVLKNFGKWVHGDRYARRWRVCLQAMSPGVMCKSVGVWIAKGRRSRLPVRSLHFSCGPL